MSARLGEACRQARRAADLQQIDIATAAGVSEPTVSRFERGVRWVDQVEAIVTAYERECGLEDGELWRRAAGCGHDPPRDSNDAPG